MSKHRNNFEPLKKINWDEVTDRILVAKYRLRQAVEKLDQLHFKKTEPEIYQYLMETYYNISIAEDELGVSLDENERKKANRAINN